MRTFVKTLLLLVLAAPLLLQAAPAHAYKYLHDCGPVWSQLPVRYWINERGSQDFSSIATVEQILRDSFDEWSKPCCSRFTSAYQGRTQLTALNNQGRIVLSFEDSRWPSQLGGRDTIAVTMLSFYNNCTIAEAPIAFNGYHHTFRNNGSNIDLQSVATHEVGHLLGLDHSDYQQATMFYAYTGGTGARDLHSDDIDGVCALYHKTCNCTSDSQCPTGEGCINGNCERLPCTSDTQCMAGQRCIGGDCVVPPCSSNADCAANFECQNQKCVSTCPVCRPCERQSDCGAAGFCAEFPSGNRCLVACASNGTCPGDSQCYAIDSEGDTYYLCLNDDADRAGVCPSNYTCTGGSIGSSPGDNEQPGQGCRGLGVACNSDGSSCSSSNDLCVELTSGAVICSCTCSTDADCGAGNTCAPLLNGGSACVPGNPGTPGDPGDPGDPGSNNATNNGSGPTDSCAGITCGANQQCVDGACVPAGGETPGPGAEPGDDEIIIVPGDMRSGRRGQTCASADAHGPAGSAALAGLLAIGAAVTLRRRR